MTEQLTDSYPTHHNATTEELLAAQAANAHLGIQMGQHAFLEAEAALSERKSEIRANGSRVSRVLNHFGFVVGARGAKQDKKSAHAQILAAQTRLELAQK
jgi:hypothetical protein